MSTRHVTYDSESGKPGFVPSRARKGALGSKAKTVVELPVVTNADLARARARDRAHAAELLALYGRTPSMIKLADRMVGCGRRAFAPTVELVADRSRGGAFFRGLVTCANVWACPVCSERIAQRRRQELNGLLSWARGSGYSVVMVTLTARHGRGDSLSSLLERMKRARQRFAQRRNYREVSERVVGTVTATEVTHSIRNGFHPHFHILMVFDAPPEIALSEAGFLRADWLAALAAFGLDGGAAAFDVRDASAVGEYVAKFGAAEELSLNQRKGGRRGDSRTPWQLLRSSREGWNSKSVEEARAARSDGHLWVEFVSAFRGRRQLVWSRGLAAMARVAIADELEAASVEQAASELEVVATWDGKSVRWREASRRAFALLEAAAVRGDLVAAEYGATDRARWRELECSEREEGSGIGHV